jgi:plastocyanin
VPLTPVAEPPSATPPVCADDSPWLGAFAREDVSVGFRIDLSRTCIRAGRVLVRYLNTDSVTHNLWAREEGSSAAPRKVLGAVTPKQQDGGSDTPGQQDGSVDLTPGTWRFYCSIPGHEVMARDITVTPAG